MKRASKAVLLALVVAACGGSNTGPISTETAEGACGDICQHDLACDATSTQTLEQCTADCVGDVAGAYREDAVLAIASCLTELACTADDDACLAECEPTSSHDRYEERCRERGAECGATPDQLDGLCEVTPMPASSGDDGLLCLLVPAVVDDLRACFDEPDCATLETCFDRVLAAHGVDL